MIPATFEMLRDGETANQDISLAVLTRTGTITSAYGPVADAYKTLGDVAAASGRWWTQAVPTTRFSHIAK